MDNNVLQRFLVDNKPLQQKQEEIKEVIGRIAADNDPLKAILTLRMLAESTADAIDNFDTAAMERRFNEQLADRSGHVRKSATALDTQLKLVESIANALGILGSDENISQEQAEIRQRIEQLELRLKDSLAARNQKPFAEIAQNTSVEGA